MPLARMGKLKKGSIEPDEFSFYGFPGGLNIKGSPQLIGDEDLSLAINGYLRADGAFQQVNGCYLYATAPSASPMILARYYQSIVNGIAQTEVNDLLGQCNNALYKVPTSGGAPTLIGSVYNGTTAATPMTFVQVQNPNDPYHTSGLTDVLIMCTGSGGPYVYDGTNLYTPTGWSQASGAQFCAIVNGIVWFGGIPAFPNQIFGTGDGIVQSMESLPAIRNFVCSAPVTGLCAQGSGATATLVIGLNQGLSVLYGTGPSTFYKQDIPMSDGVTAARSMCSDNGNLYFLGNSAVYAFDGQSIPVQISRKIEPWVLNDPFTPGYPLTQERSLSWAMIYNNRYHLGYCSGANLPNTVLVYDTLIQGWTVLVPPTGFASMALLNAPSDADPTVAVVGTTIGTTYEWDYVPASTTSPAYWDAPTNSQPVLAQVQTKYFKLGTPGTNKMLLRFYPEYTISGTFTAVFSVTADYGASIASMQSTSQTISTTALLWDIGLWGTNTWASSGSFTSFGPPLSRLDFNVQAESFSFGVANTVAQAPWTWSGGSGVFKQAGRT